MVQLTLPVLHRILTYVFGLEDQVTTNSCSVVCYDWARFHQRFAYTTVTVNGERRPDDFKRALTRFIVRPDLAKSVTKLVLKGAFSWLVGTPVNPRFIGGELNMDILTALLRKLPRVERLAIRGCTWTGVDILPTQFTSTKLKSIVIEDVHCADEWSDVTKVRSHLLCLNPR